MRWEVPALFFADQGHLDVLVTGFELVRLRLAKRVVRLHLQHHFMARAPLGTNAFEGKDLIRRWAGGEQVPAWA